MAEEMHVLTRLTEKGIFLVGIKGDTIVIGMPMRTARMSKDDALNLAAWLVSLLTNPEGDK